jgi:hypothetical protein
MANVNNWMILMPNKSELQSQHDQICTYYLAHPSIKATAKHFTKQPEQIRRILARNDINAQHVRSDWLATQTDKPKSSGGRPIEIEGKIYSLKIKLTYEQADWLDRQPVKARAIAELIQNQIDRV